MEMLYTQRSPYARKIRILAAEKGIDLKLTEVDLLKQPDALTSRNPVGKIPTLILDDGTALCDSPLICEYLDCLRKEPGFIPAAGDSRWRVLNMAAIADGLMDRTVGMYLEKLRHPDDANQDFLRAQEQHVQRCLEYFNQRPEELKEWHLGTVGLVCALGYIRLRFSELFPRDQYDVLHAWWGGLQQRPSVAATEPRV